MDTKLPDLFTKRVTDPAKFPPPDVAGLFEVMDHTGDTKFIWDRNNADEVEEARAMFDRMTKPRSKGGRGFAAFHVTGKDGEKGDQMREFDPKAERVIFVPPLAGG